MNTAVLLKEGEAQLSPLLHSLDAAAQRLGISRRKFDTLVQDGSVRSIRIGSRVLVAESALQSYVAAAMEKPE